MTTIRYFEEDGVCHLTVDGHAGYAPDGQDIVCAAVSTLICTLNGCLQEAYDRGCLAQYDTRMEPGDVQLCWTPETDATGRIRCIWETVEMGLSLLAGQYPAYVEMEE